MKSVNEVTEILNLYTRRQIKRMACEILNSHAGIGNEGFYRPSDITIADARQIVVEEVLFHGYQL